MTANTRIECTYCRDDVEAIAGFRDDTGICLDCIHEYAPVFLAADTREVADQNPGDTAELQR